MGKRMFYDLFPEVISPVKSAVVIFPDQLFFLDPQSSNLGSDILTFDFDTSTPDLNRRG